MDNKYIIYVGSGGLCHMMNGLSTAINYAISHNRILIIDCLRHGPFNNKVLNYFDININGLKIEENYDSIINEKYHDLDIKQFMKIMPTLGKTPGYHIDKYNVSAFYPNEINNKIIVYVGCGISTIPFNENIKIKADLINKFNLELNDSLSKEYISIHFRNTDLKHDINVFISNIQNNKSILKTKNINSIFIATDDYNAFNIFKEKLPEYNLFKVTEIENCQGKPIHYKSKDKNKAVRDVLKDMYVILKSKYFIPSKNSGVSKWIMNMIYTKKNIYNLDSVCELL